MMGSGVHPEPAMRESQLAGLWTAACDAGWSQSCAVFGLPFAPLKLTFLSSQSFAEKRELHSRSAFKFHIGLTPILKLVRVNHKDLERRFDENKKSTLSDAPIYIMGSKMPSV